MTPRHQVGPDTVVHFSYRLYDEEGDRVEETGALPPMSFLFGYGQLHPAVEGGFEGLFQGDERRSPLPRDIFGARDEAAIIEVSRTELPEGAVLGDEFEAEAQDGSTTSLVVLELTEDLAVLDANHPLAGQAAELWVRVEAVRPATSLEIQLATEELEAHADGVQPLLPGSRLLQRPATGCVSNPDRDDPSAPSDGSR